MPSKSSAWFLAKFLAGAAALFWLWNHGLAEAYGSFVLAAVRVLSPLLTGYEVDTGGGSVAFVGGEKRLALPLNLRETCVGIVPYTALVLAAARRTANARAAAIAIGFAAMYPVQVAVVTMTPLMMTPHEQWVSSALDVVYTFAALGGLVAFPLFLWWMWWKLSDVGEQA